MSGKDAQTKNKKLKVEFLYFKNCPSHKQALENLKAALRETHTKADLVPINVDSPEQAEKVGFQGSPSIRINGEDLEGRADAPNYSCRLYHVNGKPTLVPSKERIMEAGNLQVRSRIASQKNMARRLHQISTYLLIALGVVHTSLTPFFNEGFSVEAMYFASAGLAMIVVGFLNIAMSRNKSSDRVLVILCYIANVLYVVFGLLTAQALGEPQAYFGLVLILTMTVTSFLVGMRKNEAA